MEPPLMLRQSLLYSGWSFCLPQTGWARNTLRYEAATFRMEVAQSSNFSKSRLQLVLQQLVAGVESEDSSTSSQLGVGSQMHKGREVEGQGLPATCPGAHDYCLVFVSRKRLKDLACCVQLEARELSTPGFEASPSSAVKASSAESAMPRVCSSS